MESAPPEVWLRGPLPAFPPELMPIAHSLLQVREELASTVLPLSHDELDVRPGGVASVRFHVRHLAGSLDRLLTYARAERLNDEQRAALAAEQVAGPPGESPSVLVQRAHEAIDRALDQLRATAVETLHEQRAVGRAALPSTVLGLLFHAAEHAQRHSGQIATTAKIVRASRTGD